MSSFVEGKHSSPAETADRLVRVGSKYQATAPSVADGSNTYLLIDAAGRILITGEVAHDAVDAGNPQKIGGKATTAIPAAVADADRVNAWFDPRGRMGVFLGGYNTTATGTITTAGQLHIAQYAPGASEVKGTRITSSGTIAKTAADPAAGKKARIVDLSINSESTTAAQFEVFFGTGTTIGTDPSKAIFESGNLNSTSLGQALSWPDGGGPIGAADENVTFRVNVDGVGGNGVLVVHWREE